MFLHACIIPDSGRLVKGFFGFFLNLFHPSTVQEEGVGCVLKFIVARGEPPTQVVNKNGVFGSRVGVVDVLLHACIIPEARRVVQRKLGFIG